MPCDHEATCVTCGGFIGYEDLYEDIDGLGSQWTFHKVCFERFNNKDYKKKVK